MTTKGEPKTLSEVWQILKEHGLEGTYCPHCDQFSQARVLLKQDAKISELVEALKSVELLLHKIDLPMPEIHTVHIKVQDALSSVKGE